MRNRQSLRIKRWRVLTFVWAIALLGEVQSQTSRVQKYEQFCTKGNDYSTSFRTVGSRSEVWFTTSDGMRNQRSRRLVRVQCSDGTSPFAGIPELNQREEGEQSILLDGSPSFQACDSTVGLMATNRFHAGVNSDNDIYEIRLVNGLWAMTRCDKLCSDSWDDSPTFSEDGSTVLFASGRRFPGTGKTDIYLSHRSGNSWTEPVLLDPNQLNTQEFSEEAPFLSTDNYLYFSTDKSGDLDIWRVKIDPTTGRLLETPKALDIDGVNRSGSDEAVPTISSGGHWLLFSSNRLDSSSVGSSRSNKQKDYDIYYVRISAESDSLPVQVFLRTKRFDQSFQEWVDDLQPCTTQLNLRDLSSGKDVTQNLTATGKATVPIPPLAGDLPCTDTRFRSLILHATAPTIPGVEFTSEKDTLVYDVLTGHGLTQTLYVWDVSVLSDSCVQNFPIEEVQFFLTAYWCPTTLKYSGLCSCESIFHDPECNPNENFPEPEVCEEGDIYQHTLSYRAPTITTSKQAGLCTPDKELNDLKQQKLWAERVDEAFEKFTESMRVALQKPCVVRAINSGEKITVRVIGWTDPRSIRSNCLYTGRDIDFNTSDIQLDDMETKRSRFIKNGILKHNTSFALSRAFGNELLSDVRAYYTAELLDKLWATEIPEYATLRSKNKVAIIAEGKAIKQEQKSTKRDEDYALRRSANIIVTAPKGDAATDKRREVGGRKIVVSKSKCVSAGK